MRSDNSRHVVAAARQRAERTRERAVAALRRMDATGQRITFDTVARQAGVSRSWLYTQDDLRAEIERLRRPPSATSPTPPPQRQRASEPSLLRRLETATARIRNLEADNQQLRDELDRLKAILGTGGGGGRGGRGRRGSSASGPAGAVSFSIQARRETLPAWNDPSGYSCAT